jgi:hypothetical protein
VLAQDESTAQSGLAAVRQNQSDEVGAYKIDPPPLSFSARSTTKLDAHLASALYHLLFFSPPTLPPLLHSADHYTPWLSAPSLRTRTSTCCAGRAGSSWSCEGLLTVAQSRCLRDTHQRIRTCCRRRIRELLQVRAAQTSSQRAAY